MSAMAMGALICFCGVLAASASAEDKQDGKCAIRGALYKMTLSDGSKMSIWTSHVMILCNGSERDVRASPSSLEKPQTMNVQVSLEPKPGGREEGHATWVAENVTTLRFTPGIEHYYALVKVSNDRVFLFFTWNGRHCTIDKKNGEVLDRGEGDDALKRYDELTPLKLLICQPSIGHFATEEEAKEIDKHLKVVEPLEKNAK